METLREQQQLKMLYPQLSDADLQRAQVTLEQYFALAWEIYEESILNEQMVDSTPKTSYDVNTKVDSSLPLSKL